jgi:hypothetical protein
MKGILFKPEMVEAIVDGTKTMTRRIAFKIGANARPPYLHGETIYIKESYYAFGYWTNVKGEKTKGGKQKTEFVDLTTRNKLTHQFTFTNEMRLTNKQQKQLCRLPKWEKRSALFMPEKVARWFLYIDKQPGLQQLNLISDEHAKREGIKRYFNELFQEERYFDYMAAENPHFGKMVGESHEWRYAGSSFKSLWIKINGEHSWDNNPTVWVISFKLKKDI